MANSQRRTLDNVGNQFMPMNVEGGSWDEHFISTKKLVFIGVIMFSLLFIMMYAADQEMSGASISIYLGVWLLATQWIVRYIIFEEKFYYKMYKVMKNHEITTPAIFWDIASIKDGYDGAILTYSDTKVGIVIRLERDTITGKHPDFRETHYDAISDFYRELMQYKYSFVQMSIMEQAGNDPRLEELDKLIHKSDNKNIRELMEKEIGYIKNISHGTLYESDYVLVYTSDLQKVDSIVSDVIECLYKIMDGAYIGYRVLSARELIDFVKEVYGVKYFNYTQATLDMFKLSGVSTTKPFSIAGIKYTDGNYQEITAREINKIYLMASDVLSGARKIEDIAIQEALNLENKKEYIEVDLNKIAEGYYVETPIQVENPGRASRRIGLFKRGKQGKSELDTAETFSEVEQSYDDTLLGWGDAGDSEYPEDSGEYPDYPDYSDKSKPIQGKDKTIDIDPFDESGDIIDF